MKTVKKTKLTRLADEYREALRKLDEAYDNDSAVPVTLHRAVNASRAALLAWAESKRRR